jgi:CheY-like chemotaxis protein
MRRSNLFAMPVVLICAPDPLMDDLHGTLLWRQGIDRHLAADFGGALVSAVAVQPDLVVIDRELPRAVRLVEDLRADAATRTVSIAIVARGEIDALELQLLEAGANAILRLPADPEWDERLARLIHVPSRRQARIPVRLEFEGRAAGSVEALWGSILNLSLTGMLVESGFELSIGADLDCAFRLPGDSAAVVGCARVVRQQSPGRYGVEFYALEADGSARVRGFIEGATPGRPAAH